MTERTVTVPAAAPWSPAEPRRPGGTAGASGRAASLPRISSIFIWWPPTGGH